MSTIQDKIEQLLLLQKKIEAGGGQKGIDRQHSLGKKTARERIDLLLDPGSFIELDQFVTHRCTNFDMPKKELPADGIVTGYGTIDGRLVFVYVQDFTVAGGSLGEMHANKIAKMQDMAVQMGAPVIGLLDSGGARIQEGVDALAGFGRMFYRNTRASGVIPQISAIMGPCAGGAVYSPAITDFIFMVRKSSQMFITGPQVIKTVTAEEITAENLGGADAHSSRSGVAHFTANSDEECLSQIRYLLSFLPANNTENPPKKPVADDMNRQEEMLNRIIPDSANQPYDVKEVIRLLVDEGEFLEIQAQYAPNMVIGYARMNGETIGIVANQPLVMAGCLDINASDKAARFIRFCDCFNIPILTLVDVPGFLPGSTQEHNGIIRHGAKILFAYCEATVPKVSLMLRKAYGGAYIAMNSKEIGADLVLAWPSAEIAVMGAEGAAKIIFRGVDNLEELIQQYEADFNNPYQAAARGYVDQVIVPSQSRPRLISAFTMLKTKRDKGLSKKHGNIPL